MNRLECRFTALREYALNGTDHAIHREQTSMTRRYIAWRNRHTADPRLPRIVKPATAARYGISKLSKRNLTIQRRTAMTPPSQGAPGAPILPDDAPVPGALLGRPDLGCRVDGHR